MAKGYVDHKADYAEMKRRMQHEGKMQRVEELDLPYLETDAHTHDHAIDADHGRHVLMPSDEPPEGWDAFLALNVKKNVQCQVCGQMCAEVRPFGPNYESICEECADADPETTELRWRELNPNG